MEHLRKIEDFLTEAKMKHTIESYSNDLLSFTGLIDDGSISNMYDFDVDDDELEYYPQYSADDDKDVRERNMIRKKIYYKEIFKIFKESHKKKIHDFLESHLLHRVGMNYITAIKFKKDFIIVNNKKINLPKEAFTALADLNDYSTIGIDKKIHGDIDLYDLTDLKINFDFENPFDIIKFIIFFLPANISKRFFEISNPVLNSNINFDEDLISIFQKYDNKFYK